MDNVLGVSQGDRAQIVCIETREDACMSELVCKGRGMIGPFSPSGSAQWTLTRPQMLGVVIAENRRDLDGDIKVNFFFVTLSARLPL
jgi:hypothetical protein